jgi:hypothetical protein
MWQFVARGHQQVLKFFRLCFILIFCISFSLALLVEPPDQELDLITTTSSSFDEHDADGAPISAHLIQFHGALSDTLDAFARLIRSHG